MDYDLAKELEDAGFPSGKDFEQAYGDNPMWIEPSLSELIEACQKKTPNGLSLSCRDFKTCAWEASDHYENDLASIGVNGETPEEAVARLWLALNKK